ncbi:MAG: acyl-CoA dehydrogenase, partial [Pseudomonadota bacterium]
RAFALVLGGHYLLKGVLADPSDADRAALARVHIRQVMAIVPGLCAAAREAAEPLYALDAEGLAS